LTATDRWGFQRVIFVHRSRSNVMRKTNLFLVVACAAVLHSAYADGGLRGLEMDVMDADESPAQATARIALPGASATLDDGKRDSGELFTGEARGGAHGGEAAALGTAEPAGPPAAAEAVGEGGAETSDSIDLGAPDTSDGGGTVDVGGSGEEPIEPGVIDGDGTIGIVEPGGGDDTPLEEPPVHEIPIGELPGDGTDPGDGIVVDEPPADEAPPIEDVDGDPTGGDGVDIQPEPSEAPGDTGAAADDRGAATISDHR
jgi:hypothetical protein